MLDRRAAAVRAELDEAVRLREEAEAMLADANRRRTEALAEAEALLAGAREEAARLAAATAEEARAAARRREQMALERIAAAEKAAVEEVRLAAAGLAASAAEQVIRRELTRRSRRDADRSRHRRAVGRVRPPRRLTALRAPPPPTSG